VTCIDPRAKDQVANYKCTCIVAKSNQSALDCDGGGGGVGSGQTGEEGEQSGGEGVEGEEEKVGNFIFTFHYFFDRSFRLLSHQMNCLL
jgi:hypothetical protein